MRLLENKKAGLEYEFLEVFEAGIELKGFEVKALRAHHGSLMGARVVVRAGEAYLAGAHIPASQPENAKQHDPERSRRLLLTKRELDTLTGTDSKGLTLVPLSVYNKGRVLKLSFAAARKKKKYDKRATLKAREDQRAIDRTLKNQ